MVVIVIKLVRDTDLCAVGSKRNLFVAIAPCCFFRPITCPKKPGQNPIKTHISIFFPYFADFFSISIFARTLPLCPAYLLSTLSIMKQIPSWTIVAASKLAQNDLSSNPPPKSNTMTEIDWDKVCSKLPTSRDEKEKRFALFSQFDPNGNGKLSLAEVDKGLKDVVQLDEIFDAKSVIMRAFQAAKKVASKEGNTDDYVEKNEFRLLLLYLQCYLRLYQIFRMVDTSGDMRLSKSEFVASVPKLQEQKLPSLAGKSSEQLWSEFNSDGGQYVLFSDFAERTIKDVLMDQAYPDEE